MTVYLLIEPTSSHFICLSFKQVNVMFENCFNVIHDLCWFLLQLSEIVNQGKLVSDEIIISLLSKRLEAGEAKGESGFILDGFPRTIRQAVRC